MVLMYPRTVKVRSKSGTVHEYVRVVEAYREDGKVKQRVVADLGRRTSSSKSSPSSEVPHRRGSGSRRSVVIMVLMYPRTVKVRSSSGTVNEYVRVVEAYREDGKVKQRVVADLGRKDLLVEVLPKLRRLLTGEAP